jgi:hypothetical protein
MGEEAPLGSRVYRVGQGGTNRGFEPRHISMTPTVKLTSSSTECADGAAPPAFRFDLPPSRLNPLAARSSTFTGLMSLRESWCRLCLWLSTRQGISRIMSFGNAQFCS